MPEDPILNSIVSQMRTGVLALDTSGRILYANPSFERLFSVEGGVATMPGALIGRPVSEVIGDKKLLAALEDFSIDHDTVKPQGQPAEDIEFVESNRVFSLRILPLGDAPEEGTLLFLRDTTEEKRVEAIKKDFIANVSHELRTPLASIKGYSETLLDGGMEDRETTEDFLRIIDRHSTRMSRLIDDLLVLSRVESEQLPVITEAIDLFELVSTIIEGFKKQAADKGIELKLTTAPGLQKAPEGLPRTPKGLSRVSGDRDRLEQVMVNLLDNAIKYTPTGGSVEVSVVRAGDSTTGAVDSKTGATNDDGVRVEVRDTGIGIPPADTSRIFERFYRVDKARSRELGGTGLGLAIVKHIIQGLGGTVRVESTLAEGSTFSFTLRRHP